MHEKNIITCPKCKQKLRVPSNVGEIRAKCPTCDHQFYWDEDFGVFPIDERKQPLKSTSIIQKNKNLLIGIAIIIIIVVYVVFFQPNENIRSTESTAKKWVTIEYHDLLEDSQIIRTGQTLISALQDPYLRGAVQPIVDKYSFLLQHSINMINGQDSIPQQNVINNFPVGSRQPAWVAIFRGGRILITSDYNQLTRIFIIGEDPKTAFDNNYSVIRHCLSALLQNNESEMTFEVYVYQNIYEKSELKLCLNTYLFKSSNFSAPSNTISLDLEGLASFFQNGGQLEGAKLDKKRGLILSAKESEKQTLAGYKVELSDFVVAYRAVFHAGDNEAFISLDPHNDPTKVNVNFGGFLEDTRIGLVVLQSDKRFKTIASGLDIDTFRDIRIFSRKYIPTFLSGYERNFFGRDPTSNIKWVGTRFWFYPDSVEILSDLNYEHAIIIKPQFTADAERSRDDFLSMEEFNEKKKTLLSHSIRDCIDHLNQNYEQYANAFTEIRELTTVARLMGLCSWLKNANCRWLDLGSLLSIELPAFRTERENTKLISASYLSYISGNKIDDNFIKKNSKILFLSPILDETVKHFFKNTTNLAKFLDITHETSENYSLYKAESEILFSRHRDNKVRDIIKTEKDLKALVTYAVDQIDPQLPEEIKKYKNNLNYYKKELEKLESDMNNLEIQMKSIVNQSEYNLSIKKYNRLVNRYESYRVKYNQTVDQNNQSDLRNQFFMRLSGGINLESKHFKIRRVPENQQIRNFKYIVEAAEINWKKHEGSDKWIRSRTNHGKAVKNFLPRIVWEIKDKFSFNGSNYVNISASEKRNYWIYKNISDGSWKDRFQTTSKNIMERQYNDSLKVLEVVDLESGKMKSNITGKMLGNNRIVFSKSERKDIQISPDKPDWWQKR